MCGIIAITGTGTDKLQDGTAKSMLACLRSRGPDDRGFARFPGALIGQARLSIVDIAGGHQPMKDNEHPFTVVFNGEIYGYTETRKELESRGHRFSTSSDTEVILKAYAEYGPDCPKYLDGMFAFAIWDERKKELFVARDRFGKKPFYYAETDGLFIAASEIKAIFAAGLVKGTVDPGALDDYLRLMYIPPNKTIYSNIRTLPPAHAGIVKNGKLKTWKYWELEKKESDISYDDAKKEIKRLFDESVKKRMVADVEIGSLLSGGVDSTLVTQYAQRYASHPIKTFSVGYGAYKNELPYAEQASKKIGTDHHTLVAGAGDIAELRSVIAYFDEPHADPSNFPQHLISKLAGSKVKVALSGDGADELFMGYGWYQKYWHTPRYRLGRIFGDPFSECIKATTVFSGRERARLLKGTARPDNSFEADASRGADPFDRINRRDLLVYLPGQLLTKVDRTSMMHSLEMRAPFLDTALAEFVYNLPLKFKLNRTENKIILKDILAEIFPKEFVYRRKQGFGAPIEDWLKQDIFKKELARLLSDKSHPMYAHLRHEAVRDILGKAGSYDKMSIQKVWSLLCLGLWFELHHHEHA